jgi:transcriptional regulator with XRE-family HTH domain
MITPRTQRAAKKTRPAHIVRLDLMAELQKHEITERIRQARLGAGLTQPEMADLLDVAMRTYQNYEKNRVPWALMGRISDITGRSLRWLLHGEDDAEPSMAVMQRLAVVERDLATHTEKLDRVLELLEDGTPGRTNNQQIDAA